MRDGMVALLVLGVGGLFVYYLYRSSQQQAISTVIAPTSGGQCGASYAGTGISVPCELVGQGIKTAASWVKDQSKPVVGEIKAAQGSGATHIGVKEVLFTPLLVTDAAVNEIKRVPGLGWL